MELARKSFDAFSFKAADPPEGIAEMVVAVFNNVDGGNELILPGFFAESIATRRTKDGRPKVKGVWSHDWYSPIAKTLDAKELTPGDPLLPAELSGLGGLWIRGQFNLDTQRGKEAFSDLQFGSIDEFSIGFATSEDRVENGVRMLVKGDLFEWSPVLVGMNAATQLLTTKAALTGNPFIDDADAALAAVIGLKNRAGSLADLREKEGRTLSDANRKRLADIRTVLKEISDDLQSLLDETAKEPKKSAMQMGRALRLRAQLMRGNLPTES